MMSADHQKTLQMSPYTYMAYLLFKKYDQKLNLRWI